MGAGPEHPEHLINSGMSPTRPGEGGLREIPPAACRLAFHSQSPPLSPQLQGLSESTGLGSVQQDLHQRLLESQAPDAQQQVPLFAEWKTETEGKEVTCRRPVAQPRK